VVRAQPVVRKDAIDLNVYLTEVQDGDKVSAQVVTAQPKPDPRIEELVKQAEAIKPGSGAQIRSALQGPKPGGRTARVEVRDVRISPDVVKALNIVKPDKPGAVRLWETTTGKKIIILSIEDGKVKQLKEQDLKRILEKGVRLDVREASADWGDVKDLPKGATSGDTKKTSPQYELERAGRSRSPETKAEPTRTNEMESLRRQLERISAELQALKQRLDAPRK
jgi:hypothetical protein